jgi:hypothetical protein
MTPIVEGKFVNVPEWSEHCRLLQHPSEITEEYADM